MDKSTLPIRKEKKMNFGVPTRNPILASGRGGGGGELYSFLGNDIQYQIIDKSS
jgi:hypothetical protein